MGQRRFACPKCPKKYFKSDVLEIHLIQVHYPEKKTQRCSQCDKVFCTPDQLRKHLLTHGKPMIQCTRNGCDKLFKTKANVIQHLRACHYPPVGVFALPRSVCFSRESTDTFETSSSHNGRQLHQE